LAVLAADVSKTLDMDTPTNHYQDSIEEARKHTGQCHSRHLLEQDYSISCKEVQLAQVLQHHCSCIACACPDTPIDQYQDSIEEARGHTCHRQKDPWQAFYQDHNISHKQCRKHLFEHHRNGILQWMAFLAAEETSRTDTPIHQS
jgi:hypothetical protein